MHDGGFSNLIDVVRFGESVSPNVDMINVIGESSQDRWIFEVGEIWLWHLPSTVMIFQICTSHFPSLAKIDQQCRPGLGG